VINSQRTCARLANRRIGLRAAAIPRQIASFAVAPENRPDVRCGGVGTVTTAAGLRAAAKAAEHPPEPNVGVPALDPALLDDEGMLACHGQSKSRYFS
jgi:hypothetical protein